MSNSNLLTKQEVAELMECSPRWVEAQAAKFETRPVGVAANGKPVMGYELASLPAEVQRRWAEAQRRKVVELVPAAAATPGQMALALTVPEGPNLSDEDRAEAERRFGVIEPFLSPEKHRGIWAQCRQRKGAVVEFLCKAHSVRPRTIYHWLAEFKSGGLQALVTKDRADKGRPKALNGAALDFLLKAAMPRKGSYGELSVREIYRAYEEERAWRTAHAERPLGDFDRAKYARYVDERGRLRAEAQLPTASYECFRQWFHRIPEVARVMAREGEEAFHNSQEIISYRAIGEMKPLDYVVMDHRRLDFFCLFPERGGWKLARPWLTAAIDMRTRKWVGWCIVETPSSDSIATVLKRCFIDHGLPGAVYWDNGKDFTCEWFEGPSPRSRKAGPVREMETAWRGVMETLGVRVHHAIVRRARSKIIEPNFTNTSNFDRSLPWWCGHKPTARPERFAGLVKEHEAWVRGERASTPFPTVDKVVELYGEFLRSLNEREHTGEGMRKITPTGRGWLCPNEAWELLIGGVQRRTVPADVLKFCFTKRRTLTVQHGEIRTIHAGRHYHYRMVGNPVGLMAFNGMEVELAYDSLDLGEGAVFAEGRFVGLVSCVDLRRMGEGSFVADEQARRAARRETKRYIEAVQQAVYVPGAEERLNRRAEIVPPRASAEQPRTEIAAAVPVPLLEAAEAARADTAETFERAAPSGVALIMASDAAAYRDDDEGEFQFFSGGK